jgi:choline dehydrogenase
VSYAVNVTTSSQLNFNQTYIAESTGLFLNAQTGVLTSPGSTALGFEKLPKKYYSGLSNATKSALSQFPADWPDIEYIAQTISFAYPANSSDTGNYVSFITVLLTPSSRGNVTINTTDTSVNPLVSPNWLLTSTDREIAVAAVKRAREIGSNGPPGFFAREVAPGPHVQSDEEILAYIMSTAITVHHSSRTCMMGKKGDPMAVVDSKFRVFGTQSLRVVDASVFNVLPPGHCQATVYVLAEKAAADIQAGL